MARPLRIEYEGAFYHATARGNERKRIFFSSSDCQRFKEYLREAKEKYHFLLHGYVLMSNHYHLLMETPEGNMSRVMHFINASYTSHINRKHQRSGHLFQGRYKAILVDKDNYLLELSRYIHLNPVRAQIVSRPEDYAHSSYRFYILGEEQNLVSRDLIWSMISSDPQSAARRYREFVESMIGREAESPLKGAHGGLVLGGERFVKEALIRVKEETLQHQDIAQRRALQTAWKKEEVIEAICAHFHLSREAFVENPSTLRRKCITHFSEPNGVGPSQRMGAE